MVEGFSNGCCLVNTRVEPRQDHLLDSVFGCSARHRLQPPHQPEWKLGRSVASAPVSDLPFGLSEDASHLDHGDTQPHFSTENCLGPAQGLLRDNVTLDVRPTALEQGTSHTAYRDRQSVYLAVGYPRRLPAVLKLQNAKNLPVRYRCPTQNGDRCGASISKRFANTFPCSDHEARATAGSIAVPVPNSANHPSQSSITAGLK